MIKSMDYDALLSQFFDPLTLNRALLLKDIQNQFQNLLQTTLKPYYCISCQKIHIPGDLHTAHKKSAIIFPKWVKIPQHSPDNVFHEEIVGIYYTRKGHYLRRLKSGTQLELHPEPDNQYDSYAVSVWHDGRKLGFIPKGPNRRIFSALNRTEEITCLLGHYSPSYYSDHESRRYYSRYEADNDFSPERASITIHLYNPDKLQQIFTGLMELVEYITQISSLQTQIVDALEILGYRALLLLESRYDELNTIERKIYHTFSDRFKVQLDNSEFTIIL